MERNDEAIQQEPIVQQTHKHLCLNCNAVIEEIPLSECECESEADHDFALCAACVASGVNPNEA